MSVLTNVTLEISAKPLFRKDDAFVLDLELRHITGTLTIAWWDPAAHL